MSGNISTKRVIIHRRFPLPYCIFVFCMVSSAITCLITARVQADDTKRIVAVERTESISAAMELSLEGLPKLYKDVSKSIVRVETTDNLNVTGVIVSSDGHILVGNGFGYVNGVGSIDVKVHLNDGRTVTATAAGWSTEWRLCVFKINQEGPWPAIELGSMKSLKAGEPCLVIGYAPRGDTNFDASPTARFGYIDCNEPTQWFTTTCFPGFFEVPAVVGMDGRLLGIDTCSAGNQSYVTAVDVFVANRDDLFSGKSLDWVRYPPNPDSIFRIEAGDHPELLRMRRSEDLLGPAKPPAQMSDSELAAVKEIAKKATVRLVSKNRLGFDGTADENDRWSGVIVSEDGYILTVAHTGQLQGEQLTVRLSDGRAADAVALGTNPVTDIGLAKITTPGTWPFAKIAESSTLKPGEPLVSAGYPAVNAKGQWLMDQTPQMEATAVRIQSYLCWSHNIVTTYVPFQGGVCGGGVFNRDGYYVAALLGSSGIRSEVAKRQFDDLKQTHSIDTATAQPHPLRRRFVHPSKAIVQAVVGILIDSQPVSIGTVVDTDGWILTKASVLNGQVTCRLPNQSVVVAEKRAESQEQDLALLKIEVDGLSAAEFSDKEPPSIAQLLCALCPDQILKPGIVSMETRSIPHETTLPTSTGQLPITGTLRQNWMIDEHDTPRRSGFDSVYDTDIELLKREVGSPVIDVDGRIRGIAIASRGRDETQRGPTSVLPSHIVHRVAKQLMADAISK